MQAQAQTLIHPVIHFKPQAKSNAKRFLVKTSKVAEDDVPLYLTQVDGEWGTYTNEAGEPIKIDKLAGAVDRSIMREIEAHVSPAQAAAEARVNAPAITTADTPVTVQAATEGVEHAIPDAPAAMGGFSVFSALGGAPVPAAATAASTVVRDGKVVDPDAPAERTDKAVQAGDTCPLCGADHAKQTAANEGVSQTCGGCGKTYSMATGREVRIGYKRDDVNRGYTIEKNRAEQNGVKRPSAGTLCGQVWAALDAVHATHMPVAADLDTIATVNNWNRNNVSCEFYQWRKFMGIKGRQVRAK